MPWYENGSEVQRRTDDVQGFRKAFAAFGIGHAVRRVGPRKAATADAEDQATTADMVDRGSLLGQSQRVTQRQDLHGGADLDALRTGGDGAGDGQRRRQDRAVRVQVQLGQPDGVQPPCFGGIHELEAVVEGLRLAATARALELVEDAEFHPLRT